MSRMEYVDLGSVAKVAVQNYNTYQKRTDFREILKYLLTTKQYQTHPLPFRSANSYLTPEEFKKHTYSLSVNITAILDYQQNDFISENNILIENKDIFGMIHLPYILSDMHTHDYFEMNYVYAGSYTQIFENEVHTFHEGDFIIIAPDSPHVVHVNDESLVLCLNIRKSTFDKTFWQLLYDNNMLSDFFTHALYDSKQTNYMSFHISNKDFYQTLFQKIFDESHMNDDYANTMASSYMNIFFVYLLREFGNTIHLFNESKSNAHRDFPLMMKYIRYNYATVNLTILSHMFHYSEVYISKLFKKHLDQSFSEVLMKLRMEHARHMLENTSYSIQDIAEKVGYDSTDYFTRLFKKTYHILPSQYRKNQKNACKK